MTTENTYPGYLLASTDNMTSHSVIESEVSEEKEAYDERYFTWNKSHKYLGIGSLALATLAILSPKEDGNSAHH